jgi:hypothetical protein
MINMPGFMKNGAGDFASAIREAAILVLLMEGDL